MSKHTALPWESAGCGGVYGTPDLVDAKGDCIAILDSRGAMAGPDEMRANIAYIVRACNVHYELLEALTTAREALYHSVPKMKQYEEPVARHAAALNAVMNAIRKAESE